MEIFGHSQFSGDKPPMIDMHFVKLGVPSHYRKEFGLEFVTNH